MLHSEIRNQNTVFSTIETGTGEPVLFLHGFPDSNKTFSPIMEEMGKNGFHCVAPVLRGYEPSTISPANKLHLVNLVDDVVGWMEDRRWEKIHLIGHDWGGIIGYAMAMYYPNRIQSLTTIAVPTLRSLQDSFLWAPLQMFQSWYVLLFQVPYLAELTIRANQFAFLDYLWREWSPNFTPNQDHLADIKSNFQNPGVLSSALAYYRSFSDVFSKEGKESIAGVLDTKISIPTLVFYGLNDGCFHKNLFEHLLLEEDFSSDFKKIGFDHAGHFLHWEKREEFIRLTLDWLKTHRI